MQFNKEVVLVTGASRGLGNAFARYIAANGGTVVVNSTGSNPQGEATVAAIRDAGGEALFIPGRVEEGDQLVEVGQRSFELYFQGVVINCPHTQ